MILSIVSLAGVLEKRLWPPMVGLGLGYSLSDLSTHCSLQLSVSVTWELDWPGTDGKDLGWLGRKTTELNVLDEIMEMK